MSDELNNLFKRPSAEECAESLFVLLSQVKTELVKIALLRPELRNNFYNTTYLRSLENQIDMTLQQDLPKFMRKEQ